MDKEIMPDKELCLQRTMHGSGRGVLLAVGSRLDQLLYHLAI